jgi:hypothetical protein
MAIAAYSRGQIVLPKSNMLDETRRSRGDLSYSIKVELFGQDYFVVMFCYHGSFRMKSAVNGGRGGISVAPPDQKVGFYLISKFEIMFVQKWPLN